MPDGERLPASLPKYWPNTCCTRCLSAKAMDRVSTHSGGTAFTTQAVLPLTSASGSIAFRLDTDLPSVRWKGHHHCRGDVVVHGVGAQATRSAFSSPGFMRGHFPGPPSASQRAPAAKHVHTTDARNSGRPPRRRGGVPRPGSAWLGPFSDLRKPSKQRVFQSQGEWS